MDHRVRWVVIAFDRTFDYGKLNTALQAVRHGARLIATNPDRTCPTEDGEIPDCAGMIAAVEAVTGARVEAIVGKPSPIILEVALARLGVPAAEAVIVGDRIETDIVMGRRLGLATVLVLSGVTRADDARVAEIAPDLVLPSIRDLIR
jgi:NagD protein